MEKVCGRCGCVLCRDRLGTSRDCLAELCRTRQAGPKRGAITHPSTIPTNTTSRRLMKSGEYCGRGASAAACGDDGSAAQQQQGLVDVRRVREMHRNWRPPVHFCDALQPGPEPLLRQP